MATSPWFPSIESFAKGPSLWLKPVVSEVASAGELGLSAVFAIGHFGVAPAARRQMVGRAGAAARGQHPPARSVVPAVLDGAVPEGTDRGVTQLGASPGSSLLVPKCQGETQGFTYGFPSLHPSQVQTS